MGNESLNRAPWGTDLPAEWRTVRSMPAGGAHNMAVDTALLASARDRAFAVWRTYSWERPTISFGRHEAVRDRFDPDTLSAAGLDAVRRPTGGRALLHASEVTYSVTLPLADHVAWTTAYAAINIVLLRALRQLGVSVELASRPDAPLLRPEGPVCFDQPAPGELVVNGAKLVGSAVWRERGAYLQHGSILLTDCQSLLQSAMRSPQPATAPAASLGACLSDTPTWERVTDALEDALRECLSTRHGGGVTSASVLLNEADVARHEVRYRDPTWLWRR
ncbi:MAG: hypothetical protein IPP90_00150 [Gemmatimonadaceae bacterium]|nr:hypothetical protein [Gemmatimonadaceae bacterium]